MFELAPTPDDVNTWVVFVTKLHLLCSPDVLPCQLISWILCVVPDPGAQTLAGKPGQRCVHAGHHCSHCCGRPVGPTPATCVPENHSSACSCACHSDTVVRPGRAWEPEQLSASHQSILRGTEVCLCVLVCKHCLMFAQSRCTYCLSSNDSHQLAVGENVLNALWPDVIWQLHWGWAIAQRRRSCKHRGSQDTH